MAIRVWRGLPWPGARKDVESSQTPRAWQGLSHPQPRANVVDDGEDEADRPFFLLFGTTVHVCDSMTLQVTLVKCQVMQGHQEGLYRSPFS